MEFPINASYINDFLFCPYSIMIHGMYEDMPKSVYQSDSQILGTYSHNENKTDFKFKQNNFDIDDTITEECYYSSTYNVLAIIDCYNINSKILIEKKRKIKDIYKGYIFQLYAQYYSLKDNGIEVDKLCIYSILDDEYYYIPLPEKNKQLKREFEVVLYEIRHFQLEKFYQSNYEKCKNCIYSNLCDRSLND